MLVLSLFPGIGLLDMAFEQDGFCVVRGPDVLWGGDIRRFHPPAGKFDGVIGGPPCQCFSELAKLVVNNGHTPKFGNLIPEFSRCVEEARPRWFLMENVRSAPCPDPDGYHTWSDLVTDYMVGGKTMRKRKFTFGTTKDAKAMALNIRMGRATLFSPERAVTGNSRVLTTGERIRNRDRISTRGGPLPGAGKCTPIAEMLELQGLPKDFAAHVPFKQEALRQMLGNGVPFAMGRALARAVREATSPPLPAS